MGFTPVNSNTTSNNGTGGTLGVAVTGVHVGDLIFVVASHSSDAGAMTCSDGTTTLTPLTQLNAGTSDAIRGFYLLASVASGTVTYTVTFTGTPTSRSVDVHVFTPSAAATFDKQNGNEDIGTTTGVSGTVTTTIADQLCFGAQYNQNQAADVASSEKINGVVRTAVIDSGTHATLWYTTPSSTFAGGQATETIASSTIILTIIATFGISGGGGASPFIPQDFPLNRGRLPLVQDFIKGAETKLIGKDVFFGPAGKAPDYDWPNPVGTTHQQTRFPTTLRTFTASLNPLLYSKDQFFTTPGRGPNYDWPNPVGTDQRNTRFPIELRTWLEPFNQLTYGKDKFFGPPGMGPCYDYPNPLIPRRDWAGQSWDSSINLRALIPSPFALYDWPNPLGRVGIDVRTFTDSLNFLLYGNDTFFGLAGNPLRDFPNPLAYRYPLEARSFTASLNPLLYGRDQFFGVAGNPNKDWPNPLTYRYPSEARSFTDSLNLLLYGRDQFFGLAGNPNYDFPNPLPYRYAVDLRTFINAMEQQLIGQDQFFGAPGERTVNDFPNPRSLSSQSAMAGVSGTPFAILSALTTPFVSSNWPNPGRLGPSAHHASIINLLMSTLGFISPSPFFLSDYPNPFGRLYPTSLRTFIDTVRLNLAGKDQFFGAPGQPPVYDWPNPGVARRSIDLNTLLVNLIQSTLGIVVQNPFSLLDWPNPLGKQGSIELRTFIDRLKLNLVGKDQFFGAPGQGPANLDWPVPKGYIYPVSLRVFVGPVAANLVGKDQFFGAPGQGPANLDWPNPNGYPFPIHNRTTTQRRVDLIGQDKFFAAPGMGPQYDYPNPIIKQPVVSLKVFLDPTRIRLIGKDQFFGAPGQVPPNRDWPNPLRYIPAIELRTLLVNLQEGTLSIPPHGFSIVTIGNDTYLVADIISDAFVLADVSAAFSAAGISSDSFSLSDATGDAASTPRIDDESESESE